MKSFGGLFPLVVAFDNLIAGVWRAARGRRDRPEIARFLLDLEPQILCLQADLIAGTYRPGQLATFVVRDPKVRTITVSPFRDRVVHQAVCAPLEPFFERLAIFDSHACRKGHGTRLAVERAQRHCRRHRYYLKLDIAGFFAAIDHEILIEMLKARLREQELLSLFVSIITQPIPGGQIGCGLPIGHLTSQHLANFYLGAFDRWIVHDLRPGAYVRYMDDMVLFADAKAELREMRAACEHWLADRLRLPLKAAATRLAPVSEGLSFLGRRIYPGLIRIRRENLQRSLRRLRGRGYPEDSVRSVFAHLAQADSQRLRLDLSDPAR
jgi:RNA-directed DNA polymerase